MITDEMIILDWKDDSSKASLNSNIITTKRIRKPPKRLSLSVAKKKKGITKAKTCDPSQKNSKGKGIPSPVKSSSNILKSVIK